MSGPGLATIYRRIDDAMWVSVASAGLLRRARKDLSTLTPSITADSAGSVTVAVGDSRVVLDAGGPTTAVCDCPSTGVCRHIVAAGLWYAHDAPAGTDRSDAPEPSCAVERPSAADELMVMDRARLISHVGRAGYRWARANTVQLDATTLITLDDGSVRIVMPGVTLRYPGGALTSMTADPPGPDTARVQVCAVLSVQRSAGVSVGDPGPLEDTPAQRRRHAERREMYAGTRRLLGDIVAGGTAHVSASTIERCDAAAITAQTHDHFRLAAGVRRVSSGATAILERTARADDAALADELAWCLALVDALSTAATPTERLLGSGRTGYRPVGTLELIGLGAHPWRAASGYVGLTAVFWCVDLSMVLTYTDTRPTTVDGFDPLGQYRRNEPVWPGVPSVAAATGSRIVLSEASVNERGRLSRSASTHALLSPLHAHDIIAAVPAIAEWSAVPTAGQGVALLDEPRPDADWVILAPTTAAAATFDPIDQSLTRSLGDAAGRSVDLRLPFDDFSRHAINRLDGDARLPGGGLIVGRRTPGTTPTVMPVSIIDPDATRRNPVDALHFDLPPADPAGTALPVGSPSDREPPTATADLLDRFQGWLLGTLERGTLGRGLEPADALAGWHRQLHRAGFELFRVEQSPDTGVEQLLLRSYGILRQVRRALAAT